MLIERLKEAALYAAEITRRQPCFIVVELDPLGLRIRAHRQGWQSLWKNQRVVSLVEVEEASINILILEIDRVVEELLRAG